MLTIQPAAQPGSRARSLPELERPLSCGFHRGRRARQARKYGLSSDILAPITSDCGWIADKPRAPQQKKKTSTRPRGPDGGAAEGQRVFPCSPQEGAAGARLVLQVFDRRGRETSLPSLPSRALSGRLHASRRREFCQSAAPPSIFSVYINRDKQGVASK